MSIWGETSYKVVKEKVYYWGVKKKKEDISVLVWLSGWGHVVCNVQIYILEDSHAFPIMDWETTLISLLHAFHSERSLSNSNAIWTMTASGDSLPKRKLESDQGSNSLKKPKYGDKGIKKLK